MRNLSVLAAFAATLLMAGAASAKEKSEQPKERKICRTVEVSGRVTPQRICRKVVRPASEQETPRKAREAAEAADDGK